MKLTRLCYVEMRRLLRKKSLWLIVLLCCCTPLAGMKLPIMQSGILSNKYIAQPLMVTSVIGAILWAVLTMLEASRTHRSGTDVLTDAVSAPALLPAARMTAQMLLSAAAAVLCMLIWLPYTAVKMEFLFSLKFYLMNYAAFLIPTWWISMLFAESLYQFTRRIEAAALIYALMIACCALPEVILSHSLNWICPIVITYSDAFPTYLPLRIVLYARCIWLLIAVSCWMLSLAAVRKYGRGLLTSFLRGCKKLILPLISAVTAAAAVLLACCQPFADHGPRTYSDDLYYSDDEIDEHPLSAVKCRYTITPHLATGSISGSAEYELRNSSGYRITDHDIAFELCCGYKVDAITLNDVALPFETLHDDQNGWRTTHFTLPEEYTGLLKISYHGIPTQPNYCMPALIMETVDPDFMALYNTAIKPWLVNIDETEYGSDFYLTLPEGITPFLDYHRFDTNEPAENGNVTWHTKVKDVPFNLLTGRYTTDELDAGGVHINFTYGEIYRDTVREHDLTGAVKTVIDYGTTHYGTLQYAQGDSLSLMQTSAMVLGGWANEGWSTWMEETITPEALKNTENGASAQEVFFHEMFHQWWGGLGVNFSDENIWSCEGMTVYSTYRLAKELYGEQYAKKNYVDKWITNVQRQDRNFYNRHPEYMEMLPESLQNAINTENTSTNHYSRMPLMLLKAEQKLGGEAEMDALLCRIYAEQTEKQNEAMDECFYSFDDFLHDSRLTEEDLYVDENFTL